MDAQQLREFATELIATLAGKESWLRRTGQADEW
jgi:hypothetical protein